MFYFLGQNLELAAHADFLRLLNRQKHLKQIQMLEVAQRKSILVVPLKWAEYHQEASAGMRQIKERIGRIGNKLLPFPLGKYMNFLANWIYFERVFSVGSTMDCLAS